MCCEIDIPIEIINEIESYILEHGACGEPEFVYEIDHKAKKQKSDLSFCSIEYIIQNLTNKNNQGDNVADCFAFFPFCCGFIKIGYVL